MVFGVPTTKILPGEVWILQEDGGILKVSQYYSKRKERIGMFLLFFAAMIVFIVFFAGQMAGWVDFTAGWDFPSMVMIVLIGISALAASGLWRDFLNAFGLTVGKRKNAGLSEWKRAKEAVELFMKSIRYGSFFLALIEFIHIYNLPDDSLVLRANLVVMSLVLLYAYGMNVLLLPIKSRLDVGMIEYMQDGDDKEESDEGKNIKSAGE